MKISRNDSFSSPSSEPSSTSLIAILLFSCPSSEFKVPVCENLEPIKGFIEMLLRYSPSSRLVLAGFAGHKIANSHLH